MAGSSEGGRKAAETNRIRYGKGFYKRIGEMGGKISTGGGFQPNSPFAREMGAKGGATARRKKK